MAHIQKYQNKSGQQRWRVRWEDDAGHKKSRTFDRHKLANDFLIKLENSLREGSYVAISGTKLSEYLGTWIDAYASDIAPNTERGYRRNIALIVEHIGNIPIQKLTVADIQKAYKALQRTLSGTSVLYVHRVLSRALKQAEIERLINRNPCALMEAPKKTKEQVAKFVHQDDIKDYLKAFEEHPYYPAVVLAAFCGLRRGEALGLQWADVDFRSGMLNIQHNLTYAGLSSPKSKANRRVPMGLTVTQVLKDTKTKQKVHMESLWHEYYKSDYVVTQDNGKPVNLQEFSKGFRRALVRAGLPVVRFHDLRHTAASLLIMEGVDLKTVSEILGHSTIAITADTYGHIADDHLRSAVSKLDKFAT